jgi:hypothetical protein
MAAAASPKNRAGALAPPTAQAVTNALFTRRGVGTGRPRRWTGRWQVGGSHTRDAGPSVPPVTRPCRWWSCHPVPGVRGWRQLGPVPPCAVQRRRRVRLPCRSACICRPVRESKSRSQAGASGWAGRRIVIGRCIGVRGARARRTVAGFPSRPQRVTPPSPRRVAWAATSFCLRQPTCRVGWFRCAPRPSWRLMSWATFPTVS